MRCLAQTRVKFLDQARLAQPWFADDQHQLPIALARTLPAPHEHGDFLFAPHQRREVALTRPTPATARANNPVQRHWLGHALEIVAAVVLGDEQPGDLALHPRRHHNTARVGQGLGSRRDVRYVAEYLPGRIDHHGAQVDGDPRRERRPAGVLIVAVQLGQGALDRQRRPHRPLSVVLLRCRIPKQRHQPVAELLGDFATHFCDGGLCRVHIRADEIAPLFSVEFRGDASRIHEVAEHHRHVAALAGSPWPWFDWRGGDRRCSY